MQLFFLIKPGPYFILHPETSDFGETQALQKEELFYIYFYHWRRNTYATLLQEVNFFQLNIDADCYFTAMLPRVLFFVFFLYNININNNSIVKKKKRSWG